VGDRHLNFHEDRDMLGVGIVSIKLIGPAQGHPSQGNIIETGQAADTLPVSSQRLIVP
jgi:hypothetical protein